MNPTITKDRKKEKRGAVPVPPVRTAAPFKGAIPLKGSLPRMITPGASGAAPAGSALSATVNVSARIRTTSWANRITSFLRTPKALAALAGISALAGLYGYMSAVSYADPKVKPAVDFPFLSSGSPEVKPLESRKDSLKFFTMANHDALGGAEAVDEDEQIEEDPGWGDEAGDDAAADEGDSAGGTPPADANALMQRLSASMKADKDKGALGSLGKGLGSLGAGSGGNASLPAARSAIAKKSGSSSKLNGSRKMRLGRRNPGRRGSSVSPLSQLKTAKSRSVNASGQRGETAAYVASSAFNGIGAGGNAGVDGDGLSTGGSGAANGSPVGGSGGGAKGSSSADATAPADTGDNGGSGGGDPEGDNVTPYQDYVDTAVKMIKLASMLLVIAWLLNLLADACKAVPWLYAALRALSWICAFAALACSVIAMLMGVLIMGAGQMGQGLIFTIAGGVLTWLSYEGASGSTNWKIALGSVLTVEATKYLQDKLFDQASEDKV